MSEDNGVSEEKEAEPRKRYSKAFRRQIVSQYDEAEDKDAFIEGCGFTRQKIASWRYELRKRKAPPREPRAEASALPANRTDTKALIAAIDTIRAALAPLPTRVALDLIEHLRSTYRKGEEEA